VRPVFSITYIYTKNINTILDAALEDIVMHLPRYQDNLKKMKEAGYEVIGYARKSKGEKDDMKRIRLLNLMVEKLKTRSLADKVKRTR
jgi:hypothetical protein